MTLPNEHEPDATGGKRRNGDYVVGKYRPPVHTRWQPGQSGNPRGRPKGRPNLKTELKDIVSKKITIRDGETERKYSLLAANLLVHGAKGAKGDARSSGLFISHSRQLGLVEEEDVPEIDNSTRGDRGGAFPLGPARNSNVSDKLFEHLDPDLLSQSEQMELSHLAELIDSADGDMTALSTADFERVKHIVNKGRGKGVTAN
jgi:uncharacterized protein DUF5681